MSDTTPEPQPRKPLPTFTPVPRKCNRHDGWTPARQAAFIEGLALTGSVRSAAQRVGMTPESAYMLRRAADADSFRNAWEDALDDGIVMLEDLAIDRALNGVEVPMYSYGKLVGSRRVFNDRLLMFILRARRHDRYGNREATPLSFTDRVMARMGQAKDKAVMAEEEQHLIDGARAFAQAEFDAEQERKKKDFQALDRDMLILKVRTTLDAINLIAAADKKKSQRLARRALRKQATADALPPLPWPDPHGG